MATPLLQTKLYIPPPRPGLVSRPHLVERLNEGLRLSRKLTLISAPAGFGKTTLLSEWVNARTGDALRGVGNGEQTSDSSPASCSLVRAPRFSWLSLDNEDNDPVRFLTYLVAALQTVERDIGQGVMAALQSPGPVSIPVLLTTLLNEIADLPNDLVLVLDDYHVIEAQAIDEILGFALDHLPPAMHLVTASRSDPSLALSRLRARGQLTELREADLRFTTDETTVFFHQSSHLPISPDDVHTLENRTEGWITGLQLAAVAMQNLTQREQMTSFVRSFGGSHRYVIDYLVDEVLSQQIPEIQRFLLQTSILARLSAPLCCAVTDREDSQAILEQLESANMFLIPLDGERRWYRYHHLFGDLLVHRLIQTARDLVPKLHHRASAWYEKQGFTDDAFHHAQTAGDTERAVTIVEEHWQESLHRGELTKLKRWLDALGTECTKNSAPLSMAYCWIHHLTGANEALPRYIQDTRNALKQRGETQNKEQHAKLAVIPSLVETMESVVALGDGQAVEAKAHAQKAIALIPDNAEPVTRNLLHGAAGYRLARAQKELGEYNQASAVLLDVLEMLKASQNCLGVANAVWVMAGLYQQSGRTEQAITLCENTLDYIREHRWENMPSSGMIHLVLANLQADSGSLEAAQNNLQRGHRLVEPLSSPEVFRLVDRVSGKLNSASAAPQTLVDPLSPRELEVLQLLAQGLSNREIGERLFLALDTVKGHNRRIYGKLGVKNRTQAVNKARALELL